jgi:DNA-binding IclR family transcriptional regulator
LTRNRLDLPAVGRRAAQPEIMPDTGIRKERRGGARPRAKDRDPDDRQFINSLSRGLQVLVAISDSGDGLANQEIAERVALPGPTVSRITHTLLALGHLAYVEATGKYRVGSGVLPLWRGYLASVRIVEIARNHMREFAIKTRSTVTLGDRDRNHIVYLDVEREVSTMLLSQEVGSKMPLERSATGWAWLGAAPTALRASAYALLEKSLRQEEWPIWRAKIEAAREEIARRQFCANYGDWVPEINAVAAPLAAPDGSQILTISCGGPSFAFDVERMENDIGPRIAALVRTIRAEAIAQSIWR